MDKPQTAVGIFNNAMKDDSNITSSEDVLPKKEKQKEIVLSPVPGYQRSSDFGCPTPKQSGSGQYGCVQRSVGEAGTHPNRSCG